jgi:membrane fusion protein (multidrug efflux system)
MLKSARSLIITLPFTAAAGLILTGCGGKGGDAGGPPPAPPTMVVYGKPVIEPVEDTVSAVGSMEANERVEVKPSVSGHIKNIAFSEGQRIKKGDLLFELSARKETAMVEQAKAEEDLARQNAERSKQLAGTRAISQQEIDQLTSQVEVRRASHQLEKEKLADFTIKASIDAVAGPRMVSVGQYIGVGTSLVTLVDDSKIKVNFRIPERQLAFVKIGQEARIKVGAYPDKVFTGKVDLINPDVDVATRTADIRLLAPNPEALLKPGMFARVELVTGRREKATVIPESALVAGLSDFSVYLVSNVVTNGATNSIARIQPVKLGVRMPGKVEIASGLNVTQDIVVDGTQKLVDGAKVVNSTNAPVGSGVFEPKTN